MSIFPPEQLKQLNTFCSYVKSNPSLILKPELSFFKEFLETFSIPKDNQPTSPTISTPPQKEEIKLQQQQDQTPKKPSIDPDFAFLQNKTQYQAFYYETGENTPPNAAEQNKVLIAKLVTKAEELFKEKKYEECACCYGKIISLGEKTNFKVFLKRGESLFYLKKFRSAKNDFDRAISIKSDSSLAFRLRGKCQFELQIFEKAKDDLSTANTISYNDDTYLLVKECDKKLAELKNAQSTPNPQNQNSSNPKIASQTAPPTTPSTFLKGKERLQDWLTPQKFESMKGDDQMLKYLQNEKISKAIAEISRDPTSFKKYQNDAEVLQAFQSFVGYMK